MQILQRPFCVWLGDSVAPLVAQLHKNLCRRFCSARRYEISMFFYVMQQLFKNTKSLSLWTRSLWMHAQVKISHFLEHFKLAKINHPKKWIYYTLHLLSQYNTHSCCRRTSLYHNNIFFLHRGTLNCRFISFYCSLYQNI